MNKPSQHWAIIPATGTGQRMQASRPKQYLELSDKTILQHTLDKLLSHSAINGAVLILSEHDQYWEKIKYQHEKPVLLCHGGEQRQHSVLNGLIRLQQYTDANPTVLIHDAVRPFVSHTDIDRLLAVLQNCPDGALLAAPVTDTLKLADNSLRVKNTQPRDNLWRALTPQAFRLDKILQALEHTVKKRLEITDDASAMELMGASPRLVEGNGQNIKITTPQDLRLAERILAAINTC